MKLLLDQNLSSRLVQEWPAMKRRSRIPRFQSDHEAVDFWATHDSAPYVKELKPTALRTSAALRRRVKARAAAKKRS